MRTDVDEISPVILTTKAFRALDGVVDAALSLQLSSLHVSSKRTSRIFSARRLWVCMFLIILLNMSIMLFGSAWTSVGNHKTRHFQESGQLREARATEDTTEIVQQICCKILKGFKTDFNLIATDDIHHTPIVSAHMLTPFLFR